MNERISLSVTMKDGSTMNMDWCDWVTSASQALTTAEDLVFYVGDTIEDDDRLTDAVKIVADEVLFDGSKVVNRVSAVIKDNAAAKAFVNDLWLDNGNHGFADLIDLETAQDDLENFKRDEWELPDGITAENYMDAWNQLVNEYSEMEVQ